MAIVIFHPPNMNFMEFIGKTKQVQDQLLNENLVLYLIRGILLPDKIGSAALDNDHAKCFALLMMDEVLLLGAPCMVVMDLESEE